MTPSDTFPLIHTIPLHSSVKPKSDWAPGPNYTRPIPVTSSICLDFASPSSFTSLESRPSVILAPARTWHESIGYAMWNQAKQRSFETGSTVVWCDGGEGGVSGVITRGHGEPIQVGEGSWISTIGVPYPFNENRTVFTVIGNFGSMLAIVFLFGGVGAVDALATHGRANNWKLSGVKGVWTQTRGYLANIKERRRIAADGARPEGGEQRPLLVDEERGNLIDF